MSCSTFICATQSSLSSNWFYASLSTSRHWCPCLPLTSCWMVLHWWWGQQQLLSQTLEEPLQYQTSCLQLVSSSPWWPTYSKLPTKHYWPMSLFPYDCILIVYTDNCLIFGPNTAQVEQVIFNLKSTFLLKDEGEICDFLGIWVNHNLTNSTISLTQPGLIDSVLTDLGLLTNEWVHGK